MTWVITAIATAAEVSVFTAAVGTAVAGSTALSAYGTMEAGKAQQENLERQAEQEKIAAEGRELQRRQELNRVLAANQVSASMSGITGEGTPASISLESAKQIGASEGMINLSERLKRAQLRRQGQMARGTAGIQAASTLLSGAGTVKQAFGE
tara:strand:- start:332 stop:790 length:459 start_codon:yes stop_codon:yes gene_type:complete